MEIQKINKNHNRICTLAASGKIFSALELLASQAALTASSELVNNINEQLETYRNILTYTVKGVNDPYRNKIYNRLVVSLFELADQVRERLLLEKPMQLFAWKRRFNALSEANRSRFQQYMEESALDSEQKELLGKAGKLASHEAALIEEDLFLHLWLSDRLTEEDAEIASRWVFSSQLPLPGRALPVSALFLSLWRYFDPAKFLLLRDFLKHPEATIRQRAFTGLLFCLYLFDQRLKFYPALTEMLQQMKENGMADQDHLLAMLKQLIRARDTEKIIRRLNEEIIPDIRRIGSGLEEKLGLHDLTGEEAGADKNPDWQAMLEETPGLIEKIEELSRMQIDGSDVFMSTFSQLKNFSFFERLTHWFLPFYKEHPGLDASFSSESGDFREVFGTALENSSYMCNSDKYSFCLNLQMMPEAQKKMLLTMFSAELEQMNEIAGEDELLDATLADRKAATQYIQDLYRFFRLHRLRHEIADPFSMPLDLYDSWFMGVLMPGSQLRIRMAGFLFSGDHFEEALPVYLSLIATEKPDKEWFQHAAYCYQRMGEYEKAIEHYTRSELMDSEDLWTLKKLAWCHMQAGQFCRALEYYRDASRLSPGDISLVMSMGNCHLRMKNFSEALNHYYRAELEKPNHPSVLRPASWCLFVLGKPAEALEKLEPVISGSQSGRYDHMNYGHILWVLGRREEAVVHYLKSIRRDDNTYEDFLRGYEDDAAYLTANGIPAEEIPLMADYLRLMLREKN